MIRNPSFRLYLSAAAYLLPAAWLIACSPALARPENGAKLFKESILPVFKNTCLQCHGRLKTSKLDLRDRASLLNGGAHGPAIVPGNAEKSRLYRLVAGLERIQMPPAGKLTKRQVEAIKNWIDLGAVWPSDVANISDRPWPFNRVARPAVPKVKNEAWVRNPIDRFVLAKLEAKGLKPAQQADKVTLIRRAYLDLIGTPPAPAEVDAFLTDRSPNAYEKLIDRLLASPQYGERWARHWLDLARYAESEGFKSDEMRPNAWRYRDYVIKSLNEDKPYNRFIKEQIAGDELWPDDPDALIATGFCRHWPDESNARDLLQRRQEILNDITDTVGSTVLGLTWGCARCHDHKYDPIPQKDYYRLQAYFAAVRPRDDLPLIPPAKRADYDRRQHEWQEKTKDIRAQLASIEEPIRRKIANVSFVKFPKDVQNAVNKPAKERTAMDWFMFHKAEPYFHVATADMEKQMNPQDHARWLDLNKQLGAFKQLDPGPAPVALGITDLGPEAPKTYTLAVGVYNAFKDEVQPGLPTICGNDTPHQTDRLSVAGIHPSSPVRTRMGFILHPSESTGRRSALANWLASPDNPLTARVMVNRVWHYHFGRGIVGTPSDFGNTGEKPANKELLDWLAAEFMEPSVEVWKYGSLENKSPAAHSHTSTPPHFHTSSWSLKRLHRLIMTSGAYRQSSKFNSRAARIDPEDRLLWRFRRHRLEGEAIRDSILSVSGELNPKMGGPSVMAELPNGLTTRGYWKETTDPQERGRRSIYLFVKRNLRYPLFEAFDMPDTHEPCSRREVTTSAPQALMLLNDSVILRAAQHFAGRLIKESSSSPAEQIDTAYRLAFCRPPKPEERQSALLFLVRQSKLIERTIDADEPLLLPSPAPTGMDPNTAAALVDFCHALLNSNEMVYIE